MSPTQRTLELFRKHGWMVEVVERWIHAAKKRRDLFGFADLLAIKGNTVCAVQATTAAAMSSRVNKVLALPSALTWLESPFRSIVVIGWGKAGRRGRRKHWHWLCRCILLTADGRGIIPGPLQHEGEARWLDLDAPPTSQPPPPLPAAHHD